MHVKINPNKDKEGFYTVVPFGPIDSDSYLDFSDKTGPLLIKTTRGIIMDLANVDYISSAGLGVLFTIKKFLKDNRGDLLFCNLKPQIKRLFEIVNALPKETLFKNVEEADAYLYNMMTQEIERENEKKE
jgi:anti-anti-sigma factor